MAKKPKAPKAPKASASLEVWKRYNQRVKEWRAKIKKIESDKKSKAKLIQSTKQLKGKSF